MNLACRPDAGVFMIFPMHLLLVDHIFVYSTPVHSTLYRTVDTEEDKPAITTYHHYQSTLSHTHPASTIQPSPVTSPAESSFLDTLLRFLDHISQVISYLHLDSVRGDLNIIFELFECCLHKFVMYCLQ